MTVFRGFRDAYGSWKIICILRRKGSICWAFLLSMRSPPIENLAAVGRVDAEGGAGQGRLAAAALTHHAEGLAGGDGEANVVHRLDGGALVPESALFKSQPVQPAPPESSKCLTTCVRAGRQIPIAFHRGLGCSHRHLVPMLGSGLYHVAARPPMAVHAHAHRENKWRFLAAADGLAKRAARVEGTSRRDVGQRRHLPGIWLRRRRAAGCQAGR